ncbi:MAG TPA: FkbM family methyltransferase [Mucilaginibacter sp.]|nr:FkbM family methyltransferase [Mucilaginibacter sp.]
MKRIDIIKLNFTRNWKLPGKERLANLLQPSDLARTSINNGIVWLTGEDIAIYTSGNNYIEHTILSTGTYEDEINKLIRISLREGGNAVDVGGNIGLQSLRMSQCVGTTGRVLAFEPLKYLQEKFNRNMALNKAANVTLIPFALSDKNGEADFAIDTNAWNQGAFSLGSKNAHGEKQQVIIKAGDELPEVSQLTSLELIKIDVEGFEYNVLQGLAATIEKHKPRIIFEYDDNYWLRTGQKISDCYAFLKSLDYDIYQITAVGCELLSDPLSVTGGNLFCIPA